jgi:hypothetical protein
MDNGWTVAEFGAYIDGGTAVDRTSPVNAPPIGRWFHVTYTTDGSTLSIAYDGVSAGSLTGLTKFAGTRRQFVVGISYTTMTVAHTVLYDNVACNVSP